MLEQFVQYEVCEAYDWYELRLALEIKKKLQCRKRPQKKKSKGTKANQSKSRLRKKWLFQMCILDQGKCKSSS